MHSSDAVTDADAADATLCPDGLVAWPGGGCAPRIDECPNPWQLPLIGGGCVAIGPRACPKLWDPEADVDCEPGQLMEYDGNACPEGFVLTENEVACIPFFAEDGVCGEMEIPVLGGGCKKVGPDWYDPEAPNGGLDVPYFDECGPGLLALQGGGCVQVGPRACPKLWDPEADVDCEVGDVLPCPEGWSESEDGMYCDPGYAECGPGERSLVGGACERVVPLAEDCPPGPFPEVPEGAKDVVYVSAASTCVDGCGSTEAPFSTITAAVEAVPDGGYVLVGAGEYPEGLAISKPVHVVGLCSAKVVVTGVVDSDEGDQGGPVVAGVFATVSGGVKLQGIQVAASGQGIVVGEGATVELLSVEVKGSLGAGLHLVSGMVDGKRLWVHDVSSIGQTETAGYGVVVNGPAALVLSESIVEHVSGQGVLATGAGAVATLSDSALRDIQLTSEQEGGTGIRAEDGAVGHLDGTVVERANTFGVRVAGPGTEMHMADCTVRGTAPNADGEAVGLAIGEGATAEIVRSLLAGNGGAGAVVMDLGTLVSMRQVVVSDNSPGDGGTVGAGLMLSHGASLNVEGSAIDSNGGGGLAAREAGTVAEVDGCVVRNNFAMTSCPECGAGILVCEGAEVLASHTELEANASAGIALSDAESVADLDHVTVRDTLNSDQGESSGRGVTAESGATAAVSHCCLEGNRECGIVALNPSTSVSVQDSVIRRTLPRSAGECGYGVVAGTGAAVEVEDSAVLSNTAIGVVASDKSTRVMLDNVVIGDNNAGGQASTSGGVAGSQ